MQQIRISESLHQVQKSVLFDWGRGLSEAQRSHICILWAPDLLISGRGFSVVPPNIGLEPMLGQIHRFSTPTSVSLGPPQHALGVAPRQPLCHSIALGAIKEGRLAGDSTWLGCCRTQGQGKGWFVTPLYLLAPPCLAELSTRCHLGPSLSMLVHTSNSSFLLLIFRFLVCKIDIITKDKHFLSNKISILTIGMSLKKDNKLDAKVKMQMSLLYKMIL